MTHSEFEKLVREGFLLLPEKFRAQIKNVALLIEDKPSEDIRKKEELEKMRRCSGSIREFRTPHVATPMASQVDAS